MRGKIGATFFLVLRIGNLVEGGVGMCACECAFLLCNFSSVFFVMDVSVVGESGHEFAPVVNWTVYFHVRCTFRKSEYCFLVALLDPECRTTQLYTNF